MRKLHIVYHVAAMGSKESWQAIVKEQLDSLNLPEGYAVALYYTFASELGDDTKGVRFVHNLIPCSVSGWQSAKISHFEHPSMEYISKMRHEWGNDDMVLYFHTKGVSKPSVKFRQTWRKIMGLCLLKNLPKRVKDLERANTHLTGCYFAHLDARIPHYTGNFWLSTVEHLRSLPDFIKFNETMDIYGEGKHSRLNAEFWIGQSPYMDRPGYVVSHYGRNKALQVSDKEAKRLYMLAQSYEANHRMVTE